jgi:hypothetical protein
MLELLILIVLLLENTEALLHCGDLLRKVGGDGLGAENFGGVVI